ncbi:MAG: MarR family transcriptional regulator [Oscillospiraceae bacterium]|nr:MarR family transcriptional regulator [Oscillospiraceae bacterium]
MDRILMNYLKVNQHLSQQFRSHFGKVNLTFPQALALSVMGAEGPMPISKLADQVGSANSTISGIVDRLERLGLARRTRSELDHRVIYVETTEKYLEIREKAKSGVNEYFSSLLDRLEPGEREEVANALEVLDRALTADRSSQEG